MLILSKVMHAYLINSTGADVIEPVFNHMSENLKRNVSAEVNQN